MNIDFIDETELVSNDHIKLVEEVLQYASTFLQLHKNVECAITFVDNVRIQEINREYRQKDVPTDVISFALDDSDEDETAVSILEDTTYVHHIGDIIISIDKSKEQAKDYGHSFERELSFLALHGFLHLNGYDHIQKEDEKEMFALQDEILTHFGLERQNG